MRYWFNRVYNDKTPPTGLIGPVTDMALFMIAYLDDGESILQTETISLMNNVLEMASQPDDPVQGLGWRAHLTTDGRRYSPITAVGLVFLLSFGSIRERI